MIMPSVNPAQASRYSRILLKSLVGSMWDSKLKVFPVAFFSVLGVKVALGSTIGKPAAWFGGSRLIRKRLVFLLLLLFVYSLLTN